MSMLDSLRATIAGGFTSLRRLLKRSAQRHAPRLQFKMTMIDTRARAGSVPRPSVDGYTRNVSESGIALVLDEKQFGGRQLGNEYRLLIVLELPTGTVKLQAEPIRVEKLRKGDPDQGYLIGAKITELHGQDRMRYFKYLNRLSRTSSISSKREFSSEP